MTLSDEQEKRALTLLHEFTIPVRNGNVRQALGPLLALLEALPFHEGYYRPIIKACSDAGMNRRAIGQLLNMFIRRNPQDPRGYLMLCIVSFSYWTPEQMREHWQRVCENASFGYHFQPFIISSLFDAGAGKARTTFTDMQMIGACRERAKHPLPAAASQNPLDIAPVDCSVVLTISGIEPGEDQTFNISGTISGITRPARYYFRYARSKDHLTQHSAKRAVPGPVNARVQDRADNIFKAINVYSSGITFKPTQSDNNGTPDDLPVTMELQWPFGKDRNHKNGIGIIDLLLGWKTAAHDQPRAGAGTPVYPTKTYPGEPLDLRDARFSITYRSRDLDPKGFRPVLWMHCRTGTAALPDYSDDLAAWCLTSSAPAHRLDLVADDTWRTDEVLIPAHTTDWSFCGSNTEEMGASMARYCHHPIPDSVRDNVGGNLNICFIGGEDLNTPEGDIDLAALALCYRSRSMLSPGWGARLVSDPVTFDRDPSVLTNGTLRIPDQMWATEIGTDAIQLDWSIREPAMIECIKIHQNPVSPTGEVEVLLSPDGEHYETAWRGELPDIPEAPDEWGDVYLTGEGSGLCQICIPDEPVSAQFIRLRILSARRGVSAGLDAIEVFGDLPPLPDGRDVTCAETISDLPVDGTDGGTVFAQLVVETNEDTYTSEIVETELPPADAPKILGAHIDQGPDGQPTSLEIRTRAGGAFATLDVNIQDANGESLVEKSCNVGKWGAPRTTRIALCDGVAGGRIKCRLESEAGTDDLTLDVPA